MLVRSMEEIDCGKVQKIFTECFQEPWSLESVEEMFTVPGYYNLVAVEGEEICGYVGIKAVLDEADIVNVAVSPSHRKQHIATKLLDSLLRDARGKNISTIYLEVRQHNQPAIRLYEKAGFVSNGLRKNYYDNPKEHAILMMWEAR